MMVACAMILLMTVGLAIFYGGMVRSKNLLNTMLKSVARMVLVGVFASTAWGSVDGALAGRPEQIITQVLAILAALAFATAGSFVLLRAIAWITPLRVDDAAERSGLDALLHGAGARPDEGPDISSFGSTNLP